jgi:uncharacterized protein YaaW (UPF0174 family)
MKEYLEKILKSFKDLIKKLIEYKKMKAFLIIKNQNLLFIGEEDFEEDLEEDFKKYLEDLEEDFKKYLEDFDENFQENIERDFGKD